MRWLIGVALGVAAGLAAGMAAAQGCDTVTGEKIFARCKACHKAEEGRHGVGPSLFGVVGRPVASLPDYEYSEALTAFGESGIVWNPERLASYLEDPREVVPGTTMAFVGVPRTEQRDGLVCYLETLR